MKRHKCFAVIALGSAVCIILAMTAFSQTPNESNQNTEQPAEESHDTNQLDHQSIPHSLAKAGEIGAKYDKLNPRIWEASPFPGTGDTIMGDWGRIRETLAKHNFGIYVYSISAIDYNLKDSPMYGMPADSDGKIGQVYDGQRATRSGPQAAYLTYNIPSTDTQFVISGVEAWTNWSSSMGVNNARLVDLNINQYFLKKKLKVTLGYASNLQVYYGVYVAGSLAAGTLGVNGILPVEVGQSSTVNSAPTANFKYNINKHYYTITGFQRSMSPYGSAEGNRHDALNLRFNQPGAKLFLQQEVGYRSSSAPGVKSLFIRADGFFNCSHYFDYRSGSYALLHASSVRANRTDNNWAWSLAADRQLTQPDPSLPFRGFYGGFSVQYAPPQQNVNTQYYEARGYWIGTFRRRPMDMLTLDINNTEFSKIAIRTFMGTAAYGVVTPSSQLGMSTSSSGQTAYTGVWNWHLRPGLWLGTGLGYTNHPTFSPKLPNPIEAKISFNMFF
jgi:porin